MAAGFLLQECSRGLMDMVHQKACPGCRHAAGKGGHMTDLDAIEYLEDLKKYNRSDKLNPSATLLSDSDDIRENLWAQLLFYEPEVTG